MFNWFGVVKGLLPHILVPILIGISSFSAYVLYKSNVELKNTVQDQKQVIADLRVVNEEVKGLYKSMQYRTDLVGKQSLQDIMKLEYTYYTMSPVESSKLDEKLPKEVIEVLNGR